jgi:DNA polymerase-3 subunit alpha
MIKYPLLTGRIEKAFDRIFYQVDLSEYKADRIDSELLNATKYFFDNFYLPKTDSFRIEPVLICDNYYLDKDDAGSKVILNKV